MTDDTRQGETSEPSPPPYLAQRVVGLAVAAYLAYGLLRTSQFSPDFGPMLAAAVGALVLLVPVVALALIGLPWRRMLRIGALCAALGMTVLEIDARVEEASFRAECARLDPGDDATLFAHYAHRHWPFDVFMLRGMAGADGYVFGVDD